MISLILVDICKPLSIDLVAVIDQRSIEDIEKVLACQTLQRALELKKRGVFKTAITEVLYSV